MSEQIYKVRDPEGNLREIRGPAGATDEQVIAKAKELFTRDYKALSTPVPVNPTEGMGVADKVLAGAGKAFVDIGRGLRQRLGLTEPGEIEQARELDAPLMKTGAGTTGNILGNIAAFLPSAAVPGYAGAIGTGALMGALTPTVEGESVALNTALGGAGGAAGKLVGDKLATTVANRLAGSQTAGAVAASQNAPRDAVLAEARKAGYVVPPSSIEPTTATNRVIDSIGGKAATSQLASSRNQSVTNSLARKALGLPQDAPLTEGALETLRANAGKAYAAIKNLPGKFQADAQFGRDVAALGDDFAAAAKEFPEIATNEGVKNLQAALTKSEMSPNAVMEVIKKLRQDATANFKGYDDAAKLSLARAQRGAADALEGLIERNLLTQGNQNLVPAFREARSLIAKTYDVEGALLEGGNVSAKALAKALDRGKPLSGELGAIAKFAGTFEKAAQNPAQAQGAGVSNLMGLGSGLLGIGGASVTDSPYGFAAGLAPFVLPPAARNLALSQMMQKLSTPTYGIGVGQGALSSVVGNPAFQPALTSGSALGVLNTLK